MKTDTVLLFVIMMFASFGLQAQPSQVPQTSMSQGATAPCTPGTPIASTSSTASSPKLTDDAKKKIQQKQKWLQGIVPIQLPDLTKAPQQPGAAPPPCPPSQPNTQTAPVLRFPTEIWVDITFRCNPLLTASSPEFKKLLESQPHKPEPGVIDIPLLSIRNATTTTYAETSLPCDALVLDPWTNKYSIRP